MTLYKKYDLMLTVLIILIFFNMKAKKYLILSLLISLSFFKIDWIFAARYENPTTKNTPYTSWQAPWNKTWCNNDGDTTWWSNPLWAWDPGEVMVDPTGPAPESWIMHCLNWDSWIPDWLVTYDNWWYNADKTVSYTATDAWWSKIKTVILRQYEANVLDNNWSLWWFSWPTPVETTSSVNSNSLSKTYTLPFSNRKAYKFDLWIQDNALNEFTIPIGTNIIKMENEKPPTWNITYTPWWFNSARTISFHAEDTWWSRVAITNLFYYEANVLSSAWNISWFSWPNLLCSHSTNLAIYNSSCILPFTNRKAYKFELEIIDHAGNVIANRIVNNNIIYMEWEDPGEGTEWSNWYVTYTDWRFNTSQTVSYGFSDSWWSKLNIVQLREYVADITGVSAYNYSWDPFVWSWPNVVASWWNGINNYTSFYTRFFNNRKAYKYDVRALDNAWNEYIIPINTNIIRMENEPPGYQVSYDLRDLNTLQKLTVKVECKDTWWSICIMSAPGWTPNAWWYFFTKTCTDIDLNNLYKVSYTNPSCAWDITLRDHAWNSTFVIYEMTNKPKDLSQIVAWNIHIKWQSQYSSNLNSSDIYNDHYSYGTIVADNFSRMSKAISVNQIKKNIEKTLKWVDRSNISFLSRSISDFSVISADKKITQWNKELYYFKDKNVIINCSSSPCNINKNITLIIERGNLIIRSNMKYSDNWILGIILIWNKDGTKSQVYIDEKITNWAWLLYTDWSVQSVSSGTTNNIYNSSNINEHWLNQLYWKGSFLSQNTIGWSLTWATTKCPYWTSEYNNCNSTLIARKYDLLFMRRYKLIDGEAYYWITSNWGTVFNINQVPLWVSNQNICISWNRCFIQFGNSLAISSPPDGSYVDSSNIKNAFIMDYDQGIKTNTPIGFDNK